MIVYVSMYVCILALVIRHRTRMPCITLSSVPCHAIPYFSKLSHKWYDFREKKMLIEYKVCFFSKIFV
jgi:hypothetical protein